MTVTVEHGITVLTADEGYVLKHDDIYSSIIYLGINDSPSNWEEIPESEMPQEEEEEFMPHRRFKGGD